jgi:aldose 1-epimerase
MIGVQESGINLKFAIGVALLLGLCAAISGASFAETNQKMKAKTEKRPFGKVADGTAIDLYTLTNQNGMQVDIANFGGAVVALRTPDRAGRIADIVLGYDDVQGYANNSFFLGAIIGRYANRIANGRFKLLGVEYRLTQNNGINHLHGGPHGFYAVIWQARGLHRANGVALQLSYLSKDGEEGYPGNLRVTVTYVLTDTNELRIEYSATTDKETIVNLTNHSYFNLGGVGVGDVLRHEIRINADRFTPVDETSIPTGELKPVKGTPFDFTRAQAIGSRINDQDRQLLIGKGYDHNFALNKKGRSCRWRHRSMNPSAAAPSRCGPRSRACNSTRATSSITSRARRGKFTKRTLGSVWRRSIFQTRRTSLHSRHRSSGRASITHKPPFINSRSGGQRRVVEKGTRYICFAGCIVRGRRDP